MRTLVADDQVRCAGARTPRPRRVAKRSDHFRCIGEAEVVVAGEREQLASVEANARTVRAVDDAPLAHQAVGAAPAERCVEFGEHRLCDRDARGARYAAGIATSPSLSKSARSASTSGLPVVSSRSP